MLTDRLGLERLEQTKNRSTHITELSAKFKERAMLKALAYDTAKETMGAHTYGNEMQPI